MSYTSNVGIKPFDSSFTQKKKVRDKTPEKPSTTNTHAAISHKTQPIKPPHHPEIKKLELDSNSSKKTTESTKKPSLKLMKKELSKTEKSLRTNHTHLKQDLDALSNFDFFRLREIMHGKWGSQITALSYIARITKELLSLLETSESSANMPKEQIIGILSNIWGFVMNKTGTKRMENDQLIANLGNGVIAIATIPVAKFATPLNIILGKNIRNPISSIVHKKRPLQYFEAREIITELASSIRDSITEKLHR